MEMSSVGSLRTEEVDEMHRTGEEERRVKEAWAAVGDAGKEMKYSEEGRSWIRRAFGDWSTNKEVRDKRKIEIWKRKRKRNLCKRE